MNPDKIIATGINDDESANRHFASTLVDVAYTTITGEHSLRIEVETDINLRDESDRKWILEILHLAFGEIGEHSVNLAIELETRQQNKPASSSPNTSRVD